MNILIIEDDPRISADLKRGLAEEGYFVEITASGEDGELMASIKHFDLIILDVILPDKIGTEVCRSLRNRNIKTPILMLSCKDTFDEKAEGLYSGADDYLSKPFSFIELTARILALLRRPPLYDTNPVKKGNLVLDTITKEAHLDGQALNLSPKEFALLEYFLRNQNQLLTRAMIERAVWGDDGIINPNLIDVYISRLRSKIETSNSGVAIETLKGFGYKLK